MRKAASVKNSDMAQRNVRSAIQGIIARAQWMCDGMNDKKSLPCDCFSSRENRKTIPVCMALTKAVADCRIEDLKACHDDFVEMRRVVLKADDQIRKLTNNAFAIRAIISVETVLLDTFVKADDGIISFAKVANSVAARLVARQILSIVLARLRSDLAKVQA